MSVELIRRAIRELKPLAKLGELSIERKARTQPEQKQPPGVIVKERFGRIASVIGLPPSVVEEKCTRRRENEEWCTWMEELLEGRRLSPPLASVTEEVVELMNALEQRGVRDPLIREILVSRRRLGEMARAISEEMASSLSQVFTGRVKEAEEGFRKALEKAVSTAKLMHVDPGRLVSESLSMAEELMRAKHKAPVEPGELVRKVVESMKEGFSEASRTAVEVLKARAKPPSEASGAGELKKLAEGAAEVELFKKPQLRMPRNE